MTSCTGGPRLAVFMQPWHNVRLPIAIRFAHFTCSCCQSCWPCDLSCAHAGCAVHVLALQCLSCLQAAVSCPCLAKASLGGPEQAPTPSAWTVALLLQQLAFSCLVS